MRVSWEEYALNLAYAASDRSEDPHRQVGACALSHDNMVLGLGYNGLAAGKEAPASFWEDRDNRRKYMIHAEANCMSLFSKGQCRLMAVTLLPCSYCATTMAAYGIEKVVYGEMYDLDEKALEILDFYGIELTRVNG
jgi:dCMP deaminase